MPSVEPSSSPSPLTEPSAAASGSEATPEVHPSPTPAPEPAPAPAPQPEPAGCGGFDYTPERPLGSVPSSIPDVDGDGQRDTMYLTADRVLGVISSTGADVTYQIESASPVPVAVLAANADRTGPVEFLISDGRTVELIVFTDCRLRPVINTRDGQPWLFDLGSRGTATGVGCVEIAGRTELVGLNIERDDSDTVEWSRTIVTLEGSEATVGATDRGTFSRPADQQAIDLLTTVSCGELTMSADGIAQPPPEG
jgi:hypothetical protein